jgi:hypothetical protein
LNNRVLPLVRQSTSQIQAAWPPDQDRGYHRQSDRVNRKPGPHSIEAAAFSVLADDAQGVPVEEYFPDITLPLPEPLRGAKIYETSDGPVVAMPTWAAVRKPRHLKKPQP